MPILKRSLEVFPSGLFDIPDGELPWWVAHVRSRQEKALARHLLPLEIPFYLPLWERTIRRSGRTFISYLPLFPGYVFFRGTAAERMAALRSNLIVRVLEVTDQDTLGGELLQVRTLQEAGADLTPYVEFVPGDPVRIMEGPFEGYTGIVLRVPGRTRLVISITMLRQAVTVEFDRRVLAPTSLNVKRSLAVS